MTRHTRSAAFGLAGALLLTVAGCGGGKGDADQAVVVSAPDANTSAPASGAPAASGANPSPAPASSPGAAAPPSAPVKSEGWGTLKGQVVFGGSPPPHENLFDKGKAPKDDTVCSKDAPIPNERLIVDGDSKGVKNVFVYFYKPTAVNDAAKKAAGSAKVEFDQANCVFKPHVLALMAGDKIELKSSDSVNHNVNPKLKANTSQNKLLTAGRTDSYDLPSAERAPAPVVCDIHPWMQAYWLVVDHPYFAVTDEKGNFEIKNAPAGTQKVLVWHEAVKGGFVTPSSGEEVTLKADDTTDKKFTLDPGKLLPAK